MRYRLIILAAAVSLLGAGATAVGRGVKTADCRLEVGSANIEVTQSYHTSVKDLDRLENYLVGTVAAEMPAAYGDEALKAQAIAARTYALRSLESGSDYADIGQAHITEDEMKRRWGSSFEPYYNKIKNAVNSTEGIIELYDGKPILAAFCACSGGITEQSENVWGQSMPYLKSVLSDEDTASRNFVSYNEYTEKELISLLGGIPEIQERTQAGYVKKIAAGGKVYGGNDVRQILGLKSACFYISRANSKIIFTVHGYGHGVGMSQVGAGAMASEGKTCEEILSHYYTDAYLARISTS